MIMLTGMLLQRYLLATAVTFGLLALLGWLAARVAARQGLAHGSMAASGAPLAQTTFKPLSNQGFVSMLRRLFFSPTSGKTENQKITRLSTLMLTAHHQIHKVQDGRRVYLLATGPQGTTVISSSLEAAPPELVDYATSTVPMPRNPNSLADKLDTPLPPEAYIAPRRPSAPPPANKIPARRR